jgi:hypothetical protein
LQALALKYGLYPEVAAGRAAHWGTLAAPATAMAASARHLHGLLQEGEEAGSSAGPGGGGSSSARPKASSSASSGARKYSQPDWMQSQNGHFSAW